MEPTAEILKGRKQLFTRAPTFKTWYYCNLKGRNGEKIMTSETYTQKHNVISLLAEYFPNFKPVDLTGE
jgi:Domain of unknown function (DUF1508)